MIVHCIHDVDQIVVAPVVEIQAAEITLVMAFVPDIPAADAYPDIGRGLASMDGHCLHGCQIVGHNAEQMLERFDDSRFVDLC